MFWFQMATWGGCDLGNSGVWDRDYGWGVRVRHHLAHAGGVLYGMELGSVTLKINTQHTLKFRHFYLVHVRAVKVGAASQSLNFRGPAIPPHTPTHAASAGLECPRQKAATVAIRNDSARRQDDDAFYLFLQKQKTEVELHIYLEEGTYHKRVFRGPNTNDMKK